MKKINSFPGIAFLGDTHFGVRSDSLTHASHQRKFYEEVFFPTLKKRGIKHIMQLGDLLDRRKFINFNTLRQAREMFFDPAAEAGITIHATIGNHDIYWRDTLELNGPELLFSGYSNVKLYNSPTTLEFDGFRIDVVPWICKANEEEILAYVHRSQADILVGHFEISGFDMLRGVPSEHGLAGNIFDGIGQVISGHYHTHSRRGNICYLGTPYEMTWGDCGDKKQFALLESPDVKKLQFIENPFHLYHHLVYNDSQVNYDNHSVKDLTESYIKILVQERNDDAMFDRFVDKIYKRAKPIDLKIIDGTLSVNSTDDENIETQDPLTVLINSVGDDMRDAAMIRATIQELYAEAQTLGNTHD